MRPAVHYLYCRKKKGLLGTEGHYLVEFKRKMESRLEPGMEIHAHDSSYSRGGGGRRSLCLKPAWVKVATPCLKKKKKIQKVWGCSSKWLLSKCALDSITNKE
jgi:hypothetical protein